MFRSVQAVQRKLLKPIRARLSAACGILTGVLVLAGCEPAHPPEFLQTLRRNCEQGSAEACLMLNSVDADEDSDISPPIRSREIVQAILAGMRQGKQHADSNPTPVVPKLPVVQQPKGQ